MKTINLIDYMKKRAVYEGRAWNIPDLYLENMFVQKGTRVFFGVVLDDLGNLLEDRNFADFFLQYQEKNQ